MRWLLATTQGFGWPVRDKSTRHQVKTVNALYFFQDIFCDDILFGDKRFRFHQTIRQLSGSVHWAQQYFYHQPWTIGFFTRRGSLQVSQGFNFIYFQPIHARHSVVDVDENHLRSILDDAFVFSSIIDRTQGKHPFPLPASGHRLILFSIQQHIELPFCKVLWAVYRGWSYIFWQLLHTVWTHSFPLFSQRCITAFIYRFTLSGNTASDFRW